MRSAPKFKPRLLSCADSRWFGPWSGACGGNKVRSALTLLGVAVGACAMAFNLTVGFGLRNRIDEQFKNRKDFWEVFVSVKNQGERVPARRAARLQPGETLRAI